MRVAALLPTLLAAIPAVAADRGKLGLALGNKNVNGQCKQTSDYEADFDALKKVTTLVRTYSASDCDTAKNIIPAAKNKKFQVVLGVWPDYDDSFNKDFNILKQYVHGNEDVVQGITVGSEVLYRGDLPAAKLKERIIQVVDEFPKVTVGTVDSWNKFADGTYDDIISSPKINYFLANGFAYWQGQEIGNATNTYFDDMSQAKKRVESRAAGRKIRFGNGETGWPTDGGTDYEAAIAKTEYAAKYWKDAVCGVLTWGVDVFYFEAFDEPWKPVSKGDNGEEKDETHWGLFTSDRKPKFDYSCPK
ncbi:glycoside hydrolase 3 protein [Aspergillus melleus]|uniref:Glycoside hydrolase 3 protein n=1 Tax=Aspergillus melleus TaxID=138277 RepID=A0ACC3BGN8_9EURO|nr:glycoside hydrolase 3 protein [Aspergillus melleus]